MPQHLPSSAEAYTRRQRTEARAALAAVQRLWSRMGDDFDASFAEIELPLLTVVYTAQARVAASAQAYVPTVGAEVGIPARPREFETFPEAWVGTAGDGRPVTGLLEHSVVQAKAAIGRGATATAALASAGRFLSLATGTLLSDTARGVEQVEAVSRRITTFVRMLNPPSCGRCVILAGRTYSSREAFERHPGCDCRNIPAPESDPGDMLVNPREYLDDLDDQGLARALGSKSNARAYREFEADPAQLVNAYRARWTPKGNVGSVQTAQVYGKRVKYTTEGVTRRGRGHRAMAQADYLKAQGERKSGRNTRLKAPRLMPESIFEHATDRADELRLLRLYGWVS